MRLRRIEIRNFRKFVEPIAIDGIDERLTVISGDNEDGKSTVLAALQALLFERHGVRGDAAERMQPRGRADLRPELAIEFETSDGRWRLSKGFRIKPGAQLDGPGGRFAGAAAEERLLAMLGVEGGARGAARPEQRGTWGLLWVEQGTAFAKLEPNDRSQTTLAAALEGEVGQVLGGERGRLLFGAVQQALAAVLTDARREPRGALKEALEQVETLSAEWRDGQAKLEGYERQVDELARARRELQAMVRDDEVGRLRGELAAARNEAVAVQEARNAEKQAASDLEVARANLAAASDRYALRQRQIEQLRETQSGLENARAADRAAQLALEPFAAGLAKAKDDYRLAREDLEAVAARHGELQQRLAAGRLAADLARNQKRLEHARSAAEAAAKARAEAKQIKIDDARLATIQKLDRTLAEQRARLGVSATRIAFAPTGDQAVRRDGTIVESTATVAERTAFDLEGFGAITVTPGGEELQRRTREVEATEARLRADLTAAGVVSADEAARAATERKRLLGEAEAQDRIAQAHAPEGMARLEQELAGHKEAPEQKATPPGAPAETDLAGAERSRLKAQQLLAELEDRLRRREADHAARRETSIRARTQCESLERDCERLERDLALERARVADATLLASVAEADRARQTADAVRQAAGAVLTGLDAAAIDARLRRIENACRATEEEFERRSREVREREIDLNAQGVVGLGEALAECAGRLERAKREARRLRDEADALVLLHDTLLAAQREAKERFLAPVTRRIEPYLRLLFPDGEIILDESNFELSGVRRGETAEPFRELSLGTREQLAVLVRLGFAELLRDKGLPAPVILDDALVYADPGRFARMLDVLHSAAERLQIIVLTCHERNWRAAGARMIRLADCRAPQ
jgi:chromosome segregation ATPase